MMLDRSTNEHVLIFFDKKFLFKIIKHKIKIFCLKSIHFLVKGRWNDFIHKRRRWKSKKQTIYRLQNRNLKPKIPANSKLIFSREQTKRLFSDINELFEWRPNSTRGRRKLCLFFYFSKSREVQEEALDCVCFMEYYKRDISQAGSAIFREILLESNRWACINTVAVRTHGDGLSDASCFLC